MALLMIRLARSTSVATSPCLCLVRFFLSPSICFCFCLCLCLSLYLSLSVSFSISISLYLYLYLSLPLSLSLFSVVTSIFLGWDLGICFEALSKIKSDNLVWYFFSPKEYANTKKKTMKRTTDSGFWKTTCQDRIITDKRGNKIGIKKTLVYHEGKGTNGVRTHWVMHEYHITCLPELPPNQSTYVLCRVKYKGKDGHILYGGNDSMVSHSDIVRAMNTVPEVQVIQPVQVDQPVEDGLYLSNLSNPLNVQEDFRPLGTTDPNLLQQIPEVQPDLYGLSMDDLMMPMNEQADLLLLDSFDPNTFLSDNNLNLQQQTPYGEDYYNEYLGYEALIADQESVVQENRPGPLQTREDFVKHH